MLFAAGLAAAPLSSPQTVVVDEPATDVVTIELNPASPLPPAQGAEAPIAPTPEERRYRARRLSRSPLAKERTQNPDGSIGFALRNQLHAPVSVDIELGFTADAKVQMLAPAHVLIPPLQRIEVARIVARDLLEPGQAEFLIAAVVGDPKAVHDDRVVYAWPFPPGTAAQLTQGPGGPTHRAAHSRCAIDLAVPEGTPVLAARAGTVIFLENRYFESGLDPQKYLERANQVRILHDDGSMATYAHLFPASIELEPGQRVEVGQRIGLSGNTGYSSGPHLHFAVLIHRDMQVVSIPFRMEGVP